MEKHKQKESLDPFIAELTRELEQKQTTMLSLQSDLEAKNKELREIKARIGDIEESYHSMFDHHPQPMWIYDLQTLCFVYLNTAAEVKYGYSKEEFLSMTLKDIRPAEDLPALMSDIEETSSSLYSAREWRHLKKNGELMYVEIVSHIVTFNNRPARHVMVKDITRRKLTEEKLQKSEEHFRRISGMITDYAFTHIINEDGSIRELEWLSESYTRDFGSTLETINKGDPWAMIYPDDRSVLQSELVKILAGNTWQGELRVMRPDGEIRWVHFYVQPERDDAAGRVTRIHGAFQDISEQKQTDEALRESETRFRAYVEQAADALFVHDFSGHFIDVNEQACFSLGYSREELLDMSVFDIETDFDLVMAQTAWRQLIPGQPFTLMGHQRRKDGSVFPVEVHFGCFDLKGERHFMGLVRNISERKKAEDALRESEKRFKLLYENAPLSYQSLDKEARLIDVNPSWLASLGYQREEVIGHYFSEFMTPESAALISKRFPGFIDAGEIFDSQFEMVRKDASHFTASYNGKIVYDEQGHLQTHCIFHDITERKRAEEQLRKISRAVEQNPASIMITNLEGAIEYVNTKFTQLTGYSREEVIGKNPRMLKSGFTLPEEYKNLWETITSGGEWHGEFQNLKKNGEIYYESASISPIADEKGTITHFLAVKEDITRRKHSDQLIRTLSKAIEQSPTSIMITNADGKIEFVNAKFTSFMQYTLDEVKGRNPRIFNPGHAPAQAFETMLQTLGQGKVWQGETKNRKKNGAEFWENVIISPLLEDNGSIRNYILIMEDITDKKRMLDDLVIAKEKAEESDSLKTAFLHNISHEVRTPMNAIVGFSEFLKDPDLVYDKRKQFAEIIVQSSNQLLSIITDIISIATIQAGQEKINVKEININDKINLLKDQFIIRSKKRRINLGSYTALPDAEAIIKTDDTKLTEILTNLIGNAIKFTKQGAVVFGYEVKGNNLEFFVKDTGIGIPAEYHDEIFKRFRQVEITAARQFGGSGLGLSISKAYVELLGGKMWLTSEPGNGSVFYFTIPLKKANKQSMADQQVPDSFKIELATTKTLLIAEDEDSNFMLLEELLSGVDLIIIRAINGIQAVEICQSNPKIDLVLMDIKMPLMDGFEATRRIKEFLPDLAIIAQTAYSTESDKNKAFASGCSDFISKPLKKELLLSKIREYLI